MSPLATWIPHAGDEIAALLRRIAFEWGRPSCWSPMTRAVAYADRILFMKDGRIIDETRLAGAGEEEAQALWERMERL